MNFELRHNCANCAMNAPELSQLHQNGEIILNKINKKLKNLNHAT